MNSTYINKNKIIISQPTYSSSRSWWLEPIRVALGARWTATLDRTAFHCRVHSPPYSGRDNVDTPVNLTLTHLGCEGKERTCRKPVQTQGKCTLHTGGGPGQESVVFFSSALVKRWTKRYSKTCCTLKKGIINMFKDLKKNELKKKKNGNYYKRTKWKF